VDADRFHMTSKKVPLARRVRQTRGIVAQNFLATTGLIRSHHVNHPLKDIGQIGQLQGSTIIVQNQFPEVFMALTPSTMLALGTPAVSFSLPDTVSGKTVTLKDLSGKTGLLVMFLSRHCPYVQHVKKVLAQLGKDYGSKIALVGISSNDVANYPDDAPAQLRAMAQEEGFTFPFLYDESQDVAKAYTAACTPDFFLYAPSPSFPADTGRESTLRLVYRGQLDDSRPGNGKPVTGKDLRAALDALLAGQPVSTEQKPSIGCNIKWKKGQNPPYFA